MALTTTTLSGAITSSAQECVVASATGIVAGDYMLIDQEFVRVGKSYTSGTTIPLSGRGVNGTVAAAHVTGANVTHGVGSDFANAAPQTGVAYPIAGRARTITSYSAAGAIALPTPGSDAVAILNGTSVLAMTVAAPTKDMDGCFLFVSSNGAAAHTVTFTGGLSGAGASYDVVTINATAPVTLGPIVAVNGLWQLAVAVPLAGTVTNVTATVA
jgi:hypothetical protein